MKKQNNINTDEQVLEGLRDPETRERTFTYVYYCYKPRLEGVLGRFTKDKMLIEDIASVALTRFFYKFEMYDERKGSLWCFLKIIAIRLMVDELRKEKRNTCIDKIEIQDTHSEIPLELLDCRHKMRIVMIYICKLPTMKREILKNRFIRGLSYQEISKKMKNISLGTISCVLSRERVKIKELIQ